MTLGLNLRASGAHDPKFTPPVVFLADANSRMRLKYLKEHRRAAYINLKTSGQLTHHLNEIDREANEMLRLLIEQMAQAQGISEQLKEGDQMAWVGATNNIRSAAEEIVCTDVIYT